MSVPPELQALLDAKPYGDRLRKSDWKVNGVALEMARRLVRKFHYAKGGSNTRVYLHGLFKTGAFWDEECHGIAWWIPPTRDSAAATYPQNPNGVLSLSRLVLTPDVPKNGCTFLLARSMALIDRKRWPCLVTYADQWRGHTGGIYRACNWKYVGLTKPEATFTVNGMMKSRKAGHRTRSHAQMLSELGATFEGAHAKHKFIHVV